VTVLNDADAAGIAEVHYGAAAGHPGLVIMTTLGTGIGTAIVYRGVLIPNSELGHLEIDGHDAETACAAALKSIEQDGADASRTKGWCKVNPKTGEITITLRKRAKTVLAWRLGFTAGYTKVVAVESGSPSQL